MPGKFITNKILELKKHISAYELSCYLGLSYSSVRVILSGHRRFSSKSSNIIENLFPGIFKASDFRPDVFF